ncbi:MAG: hypothetical protein ACRDPK_15295, partial [Carbonactinosporaceae bacterium]
MATSTLRSSPRAAPGLRPQQPERRRPPLTLVPPRPVASPRTPFVLLVVAVLTVGLVVLLGLNTALAQSSFTVARLQEQSGRLADRQQALERQIAERAAPQRLAERARRLGMVPVVDPRFLDSTTGE